MTSRRGFLGGLALAALLGGCASLKPPQDAANSLWRGRLAIKVQAGLDSWRSFAAAFELQGSPDQGELRFFTPLGSTAALLRWSLAGAVLQQGGKARQFNSLAQLTQELLGAELPLTALFAWLRGQAYSAAGWQVDLSQRAQGKIKASRSTPAPTVQLRLLLEQ